jgi:peptidoglycan/xylan/chitin deacetylase (PgdA/CDA1 family)
MLLGHIWVDFSDMESMKKVFPGRRSILTSIGFGGGLLTVAGITGAAAASFDESETPPSGPAIGSSTPVGHQVGVVWSVDTTAKRIALTFDDGPRPQWTPLALDVLADAKVPATFFMVGKRLRDHAEVIKNRMGPHEIGNHTWAHDDLSALGFADAHRTIERTHQIIKKVTGRTPTLLRPPWGKLGGTTLRVAAELEYDIILWSLLIQDRRLAHRPEELVRKTVQRAAPGMIVLGHDVGAPSRHVAIQQLPRIIRGLRDRGFEFVTVSELRRTVPRT